jgi:hypothetical protein
VAAFEGRDAADGLGVDEVFLGDQAGCSPFCLEITTAGLGFHRVLDAVAAEEQIAPGREVFGPRRRGGQGETTGRGGEPGGATIGRISMTKGDPGKGAISALGR